METREKKHKEVELSENAKKNGHLGLDATGAEGPPTEWPFEGMLIMDGYDDCLCGVVSRFGQEPIACYDYWKVIEKNMSMGMTEEEAVEWFDYNQIGAWMGDLTPCFLERYEPNEDR